jgi:hypothetical protein
VSFSVSGLNAGDQIVVRVDVILKCILNSHPTGNLQGDLISVTVTSGTNTGAVPGGQQTVPFKTVSDVGGLQNCVPTDATAPLPGVNFTAKVQLSTPTMVNGGYSETDFYYSWSSAAYFIKSPVAGTSTLHTYDTVCTYLHQGEYLYSQGTCGCESTWIDTAQPQFFYDPNGKYYNPTFTQVTINGILTKKYTAVDATKAVQELYLDAATGSIVRAVMDDKTQLDFYNVNYAPVPVQVFQTPATVCTCKRRVDVQILLDKSAYIDATAFIALQNFAKNLTSQFTIGPNYAQFGLIQFDSTAILQMSINDGTTSSNVRTKIDSLKCTQVNKKCGSTAPDIAAAINAAVANLQTSTRASVATPAIVIAVSTWDTTQNAKYAAAVTAARNAGIAVFAVNFSPGVTQSDLTAVFGSSYWIFQRIDADDLGGTSPDDVTAKLCKLNTKTCGAGCCGICDTACSTCLPVDNCNGGPNNCVNETVVSGSCCLTRAKTTPCVIPVGQCGTSKCNAVTGICDFTQGCPNPSPVCNDVNCVSGSCVSTFKGVSDKCNTRTCVNNTIVNTQTICGTNTACMTFSCDTTNGCTSAPVPDPAPGVLDPCNPRVCDPTTGWKNQPVTCTTSDPCKPSTCQNGVCVVNPIICGNPNDLCDTSNCSNGACTGTRKTCTVTPSCQKQDPLYATTGGCNPSTGQCSFTPVTCVSNNCFNQACDVATNQCKEIPTAGCDKNCVCTNDVCKKTTCDPVTFACGSTTDVNCTASKPGSCFDEKPCDPTNGCVYTPKNCSAITPPNKCQIMTADPTSPVCCVAKDVVCPNSDPCRSYSCDLATGQCVATYLCTQGTDKCSVASCGPSGCTNTVTTCTPPPCFTSSCDSTTGKCVNTAISCDDGDACTDDSCDTTTGSCKHVPMDCSNPDKCLISKCVAGKCTTNPVLCNDGVNCTTDSCDSSTGCKHVIDPNYCISPDPCYTESCNLTNGCVKTPVACRSTGLRCSQSTCVAYQGCANVSVTCNKTSTASCVYASCKEDKTLAQPCVEETLVCGVPIDDSSTVVAAAVGSASAAVVAGVICAVVVASGVVGGTAVAVYRSGDDTTEGTVANNPLFQASGYSGENPLAV